MERITGGYDSHASSLEWSAPRAQRPPPQHRHSSFSGATLDHPEVGTDDVLPIVVAVLKDLLAQAELGVLELEVVTGLGLASVRKQDNIRCAFVVELPPNNQGLSPREMQIAGMVADGATNRAVASMLDISLWTVSTHLRRIFAKLGVSSRAEMVGQLFGAPHLPSN